MIRSSPPELVHSEVDERACQDRGQFLLTALALGFLIATFDFLVVERLASNLLGRGAFQGAQPLAGLEAGLYLCLFPVSILLLVLTGAAVLRWAGRALFARSGFNKLSVAIIGTAYAVAVATRADVYRFLTDRVDMALLRLLGGGDLSHAIGFVQNELAGQLPLVGACLLALFVGGWLLIRYGKRFSGWLGERTSGRHLLTVTGLLLASGIVSCLPPLLLTLSAPTHRGLSYSLAYSLYTLPARYLTDFDMDGYGLLERPIDTAPFDSGIHPYATDVPANGVDENAVGGDLPEVRWREPMGPWDSERLKRKNVLLIIIDSMRPELLHAEQDGQAVMPTLRRLPGDSMAVFAHAGHSNPGIASIMNGAISNEPEGGEALITRFRELGYRTGVFSGQNESKGEVKARARLKEADVFVDTTSFPLEERMNSPTNPVGMAMPAPLVADRFLAWLGEREPHGPFFAYLNFQEPHFPYHYDRAPRVLVDEGIPRGKIAWENREWLRRTYMNAARNADDVVAGIVEDLEARGLLEDTVLLVLGDHGQELFDHGYLGHGHTLNHEQYATLGKLIHSDWRPPVAPIGLRDVGAVIHNALLRDPRQAIPLGDEVLCFVGSVWRPLELGLVTVDGLLKFDFLEGAWWLQKEFGADFVAADPDPSVIHRWESFLAAGVVRASR